MVITPNSASQRFFECSFKVEHEMMQGSVTQHKIGIASSPQNPALILFYTRGTSGLRKRVMPVRGLLEQGAEPAARRLITAHAQYLEAVDLEQVVALCTRLHAKLSVSRCSPAAPEKSENAAPKPRNAAPKPRKEQKSCTPKELDRSFLHDIAMDMGLSPDLEERPTTDGSWDAEDAALAGFARGRLQEAAEAAEAGGAAPSAAARALAANHDALAAFAGGGISSRNAAQLLQIGDEPSPCESSPDGSQASEERRRRPTSVTAATSRAAEAGCGAGGAGGAPSIAASGDTPGKVGKAKGGTPKKAKKGRGGRADPAAELARYGRSLLDTDEERAPSLESLLGMSSEDEATPRQRGGGGGGGGLSSLAGMPQLGSARAAPGMSSLSGMPALF